MYNVLLSTKHATIESVLENLFVSYVSNFNDCVLEHPCITLYVDPRTCNLNCFSCHNKNSSEKEPPIPLSPSIIVSVLDSYIKELHCVEVGVSGGEPTIYANKLIQFFNYLKNQYSNYGVKIRLETNGTRPRELRAIVGTGTVDIVVLDYKIPVNLYTGQLLKGANELVNYCRILYSTTDLKQPVNSVIQTYSNSLKESLSICFQYMDVPPLLRTVKYPLLSEREIELMKEHARELGLNWKLLDFVPLEKQNT